MVTPALNTQLALMLALQNLELPLSPEEEEALKKAGQKWARHPKRWESIVQELMPAIEANASLKYLYQTAKNQLDALGDIPPELLPTKEELKQELPADEKREQRGPKPTGRGNSQNNERLNDLVPYILKNPESANKLSFLERISQFLEKLH
ncbi:hypothetical protein [Microcoleus sp. FACHB-68]|uniref:hypothetical protein n=1 Tax=Microcoleus sp. FACHB-68 TaxID=2692826 RepID=UPI001688C981|nr:hypothetical protein [Microcoleus sp. FACHB-68]MBD1939010.1 hypothetical protein [Microcoleus sp. FACHB-68]